jgi:tRNA(Ile)-lysidine synthase
MSQLVARVAGYVARYGLFCTPCNVVVGVSGGADSLCLLHVLCDLAPLLQLSLHVAHLNHGLRPEAAADAEFVRDLADALGLPVTLASEDVQGYAYEHRLALEEAARQVRYAFLASTAAAVGASHIVVAHHMNDQAETVLMHFLRGSGAAGLRGMLPIMPLTDYRALSARASSETRDLLLVRPLLAERRTDIDAYCAEQGLVPRMDASNADTRIYRNKLRHHLLPILRGYNPRFDAVLAHTAEVMAGDYELLKRATEDALAAVVVQDQAAVSSIAFHLQLWRDLPVGLQRATVRGAVIHLRRTLRNINWEHVEHAVRVGREGETGDSATIAAGLALTVDYRVLRIGPEGDAPHVADPQVGSPVNLLAPGVTELRGGHRVRVVLVPRHELPAEFAENEDRWTVFFDADAVGSTLTLRPRVPGDRFQPLGLGGHSARVNEYMINAKVPAAARPGWPILEGSAGIAWICGLRVDERAAVRGNTERIWHVRFER